MSSVVLLVGGIWLLRLGGRLSRLEPTARHAQIVASVLMLILLPPLGTAAGIYGLVVLSTDAMRDLFDGRRARPRPRRDGFPFAWSAQHVPPPSPPRPRSARDLARHGLVVFAAVILAGVLMIGLRLVPADATAVGMLPVVGIVLVVLIGFALGARWSLALILLAALFLAFLLAEAPSVAPPVQGPTETYGPRVPTPMPAPPPVPDDRGRGRGGDRPRDR